jgi:hypothetical protein
LQNLSLSLFYFDETNLCEPPDAGFQAWLAGIGILKRTGILCACDQVQVYLPVVMRE